MNKAYNTDNFYLSCFLITQGISLLSIERRESKAFFNFEAAQQLPDLISNFYNLDTTVNLKDFLVVTKDLKQRMHKVLDGN